MSLILQDNFHVESISSASIFCNYTDSILHFSWKYLFKGVYSVYREGGGYKQPFSTRGGATNPCVRPAIHGSLDWIETLNKFIARL